VIHTGETPSKVSVPDYAHLLPKEIQSFTMQGVYDSDSNQHLSFIQGSGHGGSHPHLVNEFLNALNEDRPPFPSAKQSANITCVGILAHESALQGGVRLDMPSFTFE
jgi:phosphoheptose isomerase